MVTKPSRGFGCENEFNFATVSVPVHRASRFRDERSQSYEPVLIGLREFWWPLLINTVEELGMRLPSHDASLAHIRF